MTSGEARKDLVILVADKNMEFALRGILSRHRSLRIRPVSADIYKYPEWDPGCYHRGPDFLQPFVNQYGHALLILDREGSGQEHRGRLEIEEILEKRLAESGWADRAAAIVIDPELEVWVWSDSPHVDIALGWQNKTPSLRDWLVHAGYLAEGQMKPARPKKAMEEALRAVREPRSSAVYRDIAEKVSLDRCMDESFRKLKSVLRKWFRQ
jgi:hypothetical protein